MDGINKLLYNNKNQNLELDILLTKEEVKENLHIKDDRLFMQLITEDHLPYIKTGRQYLVPMSEYKKWIKKMTYN
jgi:excisionase family DNA binding protein